MLLRPALVLLLAAATLTGCATIRVEPTFDLSNQVFIEKTVGQLDVVGAIRTAVPAGGRLCLVSLETPATYDYPIVATIEDALIKSLRDGGFVVLERDDEMLRRMASEGPDGRYRFVFLPSERVAASAAGIEAGAPAATVLGLTAAPAYQMTGLTWSRERGGDRDTTLILQTPLDAADYIVTYRVLECGLVHRKGTSAGLKKREGLARLHLRVVDAHSSRVLYAGDVRATQQDEIDSDLARDLADFHYSFFSQDYPVIQGTSRQPKELGGEDRASPANRLTLLGGLACLALVLMFAGGGEW
jgi:hypothetical protein